MFFKQKKKKVQGISKELEKYMGELEKSLKEVTASINNLMFLFLYLAYFFKE